MIDKKRIKYLIMDIDGTLTDGKLNYSEKGLLFKSFNAKDGYAIKEILPNYDIEPIVISGNQSKINDERFNDLGVTKVYQSVNDKLSLCEKLVNNDFSCVAYIGDDLNDLAAIVKIRSSGGVTGCPADSVFQIIDNCDFVSSKNGGDGAVREFIEWLTKS